MRKRSNGIILMALMLYFFGGFVPTAYGQPIVFGPAFFLNDQGAASREVRHFSVEDVDQKFILSVQGGGSSTKENSSGVVEINGEVVASLALGEQFKMLMKPVSLQKKNTISVAMTDGTDASIIVSIMGQKEHHLIINVPPMGETANLEGFASIVFPAGTFDQTQQVTVSAVASDSDIFEAHTTGLRLPYEIRINTGNRAPEKDMRIDLNLPDSFYASPFQIHLFIRMHDHPNAPDEHDRFVMIHSSVKRATMTVSTILSRQAFSTLYGKNGSYEAVLTIGLLPL